MVKSGASGCHFVSAPHDSSRIVALILALPATALGLGLAAYVGWYRAGSAMENCFWIAVGIVTVLGTHFLPVRFVVPGRGRVAAMSIWFCCLGLTLYSHATFYLLSQEHAGERRIQAVSAQQIARNSEPLPPRNLLAIMTERERVSVELAKLTSQSCTRLCSWRDVRLASLRGRLDTLAVEEEAAKQWAKRREHYEEAIQGERSVARQDLLASRLSAVFAISIDSVNVLYAFLFSVALEGLACLGWLYFFSAFRLPNDANTLVPDGKVEIPMSDKEAMPLGLDSSIASKHEEAGPMLDRFEETGNGPIDQPAKDASREYKEIWLEAQVRSGRFKPTVAKVREYLTCKQPHAILVNRHLKKVMEESMQDSTARLRAGGSRDYLTIRS